MDINSNKTSNIKLVFEKKIYMNKLKNYIIFYIFKNIFSKKK